MADILEVDRISLSFGGLKAVCEFSINLPEFALQGLIGPNGAGKTTIFNLLTGVYRPISGSISLKGKRVDGLRPHQIAKAGLARTFQNIRLFSELSVLDNVMVAMYMRTRSTLFGVMARTRFHRDEESAFRKRALELLDVFNLTHLATETAKNLPYGHQRRLEMVRALATEPRLLLLDEPAAGMNPQEKRELATLIRSIRDDFKLTILLIEHDMGLVMEICERITVLDYGVVIAEGEPSAVQKNPKVIEAYLGTPMEL